MKNETNSRLLVGNLCPNIKKFPHSILNLLINVKTLNSAPLKYEIKMSQQSIINSKISTYNC